MDSIYSGLIGEHCGTDRTVGTEAAPTLDEELRQGTWAAKARLREVSNLYAAIDWLLDTGLFDGDCPLSMGMTDEDGNPICFAGPDGEGCDSNYRECWRRAAMERKGNIIEQD